jgi:hypothetical protein
MAFQPGAIGKAVRFYYANYPLLILIGKTYEA